MKRCSSLATRAVLGWRRGPVEPFKRWIYLFLGGGWHANPPVRLAVPGGPSRCQSCAFQDLDLGMCQRSVSRQGSGNEGAEGLEPARLKRLRGNFLGEAEGLPTS